MHYVAMLQSPHLKMEGAAPRRRSRAIDIARLVTKTDVLHGVVEVARMVVDSRLMEDFAMSQLFLPTEVYR